MPTCVPVRRRQIRLPTAAVCVLTRSSTPSSRRHLIQAEKNTLPITDRYYTSNTKKVASHASRQGIQVGATGNALETAGFYDIKTSSAWPGGRRVAAVHALEKRKQKTIPKCPHMADQSSERQGKHNAMSTDRGASLPYVGIHVFLHLNTDKSNYVNPPRRGDPTGTCDITHKPKHA